MSSQLLTSLSDACQVHRHVVYNQNLNNGAGGFERAGKRHAIASFFGTSDAKAKNQLTLTKIKEALATEVAEGGRFHGANVVTNGLFSVVDGDKRINAQTICSIIEGFRKEAECDPAVLRRREEAFEREFLKWEGASPQFKQLLLSQPLDCRMPLLSAMKAFGMSKDVFLLRKLVSVRDAVKELHFNGNISMESVFRAIKGENAEIPECMKGIDADADISDEVRNHFMNESVRELEGYLDGGFSVSRKIAGQRIMLNAGLSPKSTYEMVRHLSRIDLSEFADEQLKDLATLSWVEMDRLNAIAGFEIEGGMAPDDLYAAIMTPDSVQKRLVAYPELVADADTYRQARDLMETFDRQVDGMIKAGATKNLKASTKWMLERFVFQDIAMNAKSGGVLPDVQSFGEGLTLKNRFVRFAESMFGRAAIPWNMLCLPPEQRVPVMAAMDAYGEYHNQYLLTRLIANGERVAKIYQEERSPDRTLTKEQVFRAINGDGVRFHPLIHANADYWAIVLEQECAWPLNEKGVSLESEPVRYNRKYFMVNDLIQRYALSKEDVMDMAFQNVENEKAVFRYTEFAPVNAPLVVNDLGGGVAEAVKQFEKDFARVKVGRYEVKFNMPDGDVSFYKTDETEEQARNVTAGVRDAVLRMCGTAHSCQAEVILMVLSQALEQDLFAAFTSMECDPANKTGGISKSFSITRNEQDGSVAVLVTDMGNSALKYDWRLKINPDGTQEVSDLVVARNHSVDAPWPD
ncbi:MAG: hypothetical protein IKJ37_15105 [Kiritimatiellae bacterium]|nr:hypothetical protein [Kiritimatiellia bacterium]